MKFIDSTEIHVRAGDGGSGMVSFKAGRNQPKLGCDGGDGGHGGSIILVGQAQLNTLSSLRYKRTYQAESGAKGGVNNRTGATGNDLRIPVPLGTIVIDLANGAGLGEILEDGQELLIAKGGRRGLGNQRFISATHQAPEEHTAGGRGEAAKLILELKLLADVGFAGLPNAGKSTLLSRMSAARPKIADYPFTTLVPHLGVVELTDSDNFGAESFVAADVPGLIEGASEGKGLGHAFLRHLERTKLIAYVIDAFDPSGATPAETLNLLRHEMQVYSPDLAAKRAVVVLNKIDLISDDDTQEEFDKHAAEIEGLGFEILRISAVQGDGLRELKRRIFELLKLEAIPAAEPVVRLSTEMVPFRFGAATRPTTVRLFDASHESV